MARSLKSVDGAIKVGVEWARGVGAGPLEARPRDRGMRMRS
jgi:hypothetical protein